MNSWNQLLKSLDTALGVPNRIASTVKKVSQFYDSKRSEHVFVLQYRVKVAPGDRSTEQGPRKRMKSVIGTILAGGKP
jgi:hypothetical protein